MKTRVIHTKIYFEDDWFYHLTTAQKFLFMYFFTNEHIGHTGIYKISDRVISLETRMDAKTIKNAKEYFEKSKKVFFKKEWVFVVNACKYSDYTGEKNISAYKKEFSLIPEEIRGYFFDTLSIPYTYHSDTTINHKSKIINHKSEINSVGKEISEVYEYYILKTGSLEKLSDSRKLKIKARIKEFGVTGCKTAVDNMLRSPFHTGENDREWKADLDYLFRSFEITEKMIRLYKLRKEVSTDGGLAEITIKRMGKN